MDNLNVVSTPKTEPAAPIPGRPGNPATGKPKLTIKCKGFDVALNILRLTPKVVVVEVAGLPFRFREHHTVTTDYGGGTEMIVSELTASRMTLRLYRKPATVYSPREHKPSRKWQAKLGAPNGKDDEAGPAVHQASGA